MVSLLKLVSINTIFLAAIICSISVAESQISTKPAQDSSDSFAQIKPRTKLGSEPNPHQNRVINNNLSFREFMSAVSSQSHPERHYAEMYLLGVLDTTEGVEWCGYDHILPTSAAEVVYNFGEKLVASRGNERASTVIREVLKDVLGCRSKK